MDKKKTDVIDPIKDIEAFEYDLFKTDGDESYMPTIEREDDEDEN